MIGTRGEQIAAAAEAMVGIPFRHQGRNPKLGVDCVGVVLCSVWAAGCEVPDCLGYGPIPNASMLMRELEGRADRVHMDDAMPGDVMLFQRHGSPTHFGIMVAGNHFVHAHQKTGSVRKDELSRLWRSLLHSIWRPREN